MGKFDRHLEKARKYLADSELELKKATIAMADAAPSVRDHVLDIRRRQVAEAQSQIETFTWANKNADNLPDPG